jgi:predicted metalloprotease
MRTEGQRQSSNFEDLDERTFTHGSSEQRKRWFRRGFESGDARQCDTFAVQSSREL